MKKSDTEPMCSGELVCHPPSWRPTLYLLALLILAAGCVALIIFAVRSVLT